MYSCAVHITLLTLTKKIVFYDLEISYYITISLYGYQVYS